MASWPVPHPKARHEVEAAFRRFQDEIVNTKEKREFQSTTLEDVWKAVVDVEEQLAAKRANRNLTRLRPLLDGLNHYCPALEVLCNGTPYLPWIWAPIKFCIASENLDALDRLIRAYSHIGKALPRVARLSDALKDSSDFQQVVAVVYRDIVEFHRRAYKVLRRNAWQRFFDSEWLRFEGRYAKIIEDLKDHAEDIEREANAHGISAVLQLRKQALDEFDRIEADRTKRQFIEVRTWLNASERQETRLHDLLRSRHADTCSWLMDHPIVKAWRSDRAAFSRLWVHGIPGSGKSVLCAHMIETLVSVKDLDVLYFFCDFQNTGNDSSESFFRSMVSQAVTKQPHLATFIYDEYVAKGVSLTPNKLSQLSCDILNGLGSFCMVIDGLDESGPGVARQILQTLKTILDKASFETKLAVFSRGLKQIHELVKTRHELNLSLERIAVDHAIQSFVHHEMQELRERYRDVDASQHEFDLLEKRLVQKAGGMFLWVRLVLYECSEAYSIHDIHARVKDIPGDLQKAYERCLRLMIRKHYAKTIFQWVAFAKRPLKVFELVDGVALSHGPYNPWNANAKLLDDVIEQAKPLIEVTSDGFVRFVHFTVSEFLVDAKSGSTLQTGPLISDIDSTKALSLACASYFKLSLTLIDPGISDRERVEAVCAGLHGLHWYALAHGWDHLQRLGDLRNIESSVSYDDKVSSELASWTLYHRTLFQDMQVDTSASATNTSTTSWNSICNDPEFPALATEFQQNSAGERLPKTLPSSANIIQNDRDITAHAMIRSTLDTIIRRLLDRGCENRLPYLSAESLRRFRLVYDRMNYTCRFPRCDKPMPGFSTENERDIHEQSHQPKITCSRQECLYSDKAFFKSSNELAKHVRRWHSETLSAVPQFADPGIDSAVPQFTDHGIDAQQMIQLGLMENERMKTNLTDSPPHDSQVFGDSERVHDPPEDLLAGFDWSTWDFSPKYLPEPEENISSPPQPFDHSAPKFVDPKKTFSEAFPQYSSPTQTSDGQIDRTKVIPSLWPSDRPGTSPSHQPETHRSPLPPLWPDRYVVPSPPLREPFDHPAPRDPSPEAYTSPPKIETEPALPTRSARRTNPDGSDEDALSPPSRDKRGLWPLLS